MFLQTEVPAAQGGIIPMLLPIILLGAMFYFMLCAPAEAAEGKKSHAGLLEEGRQSRYHRWNSW